MIILIIILRVLPLFPLLRLCGGPISSTGDHADLPAGYRDIPRLLLFESVLQLVRLLLQFVILADDLLVGEVLHVLVDAEFDQDVQLALAEDQEHEHENRYQHYVHEEDGDVVGETRIHHVVVPVILLESDNVEDIERGVEQDLDKHQDEQDCLWSEVLLPREEDESYADDDDWNCLQTEQNGDEGAGGKEWEDFFNFFLNLVSLASVAAPQEHHH